MKTIIIFLVFSISSFLFGQNTPESFLEYLNKRTNIKVLEIQSDIIKLQLPDGSVIYENIGKHQQNTEDNLIYSPTFDSTIIDLRTLDTSSFYNKYSFYKEVKVGTDNTKPPLVADINNNGRAEIYGQMKNYYSGYSGVVIMEQNANGNFDSVFTYDSTSILRSVIDVNKDSLNELLLHRFPPDTNIPGQNWSFFTQLSRNEHATNLFFNFNPFTSSGGAQLNQNIFGDWDGDEYTDQIFGKDCCPNTIYIFEYNPLTNNFDSIYYYDPSQYDFYFSGFAIGDINQNGKAEFFAGSVNGKIVAFENCGDNCYQKIWNTTLPTYNAYLYAVTNDMDNNGKPEVWLGGYHFEDGTSKIRLLIFEAGINNDYVAVGKIDLLGPFNWYCNNTQVLDVDKDGKDEIMLAVEQNVVILKFNGSINHQSFEVFYAKGNDLVKDGRYSVFYGATMYGVTNDGKEDIIIHMNEIIPNVGIRFFTFIYKSDIVLDVNEPELIPTKFQVYQNHPNPFNPSTSIRFDLVHNSDVTLKVYNILGKEIVTLTQEGLSPGTHTINWEAKDNNGQLLPSGIYLLKINAVSEYNSDTKTIKSVLLK